MSAPPIRTAAIASGHAPASAYHGRLTLARPPRSSADSRARRPTPDAASSVAERMPRSGREASVMRPLHRLRELVVCGSGDSVGIGRTRRLWTTSLGRWATTVAEDMSTSEPIWRSSRSMSFGTADRCDRQTAATGRSLRRADRSTGRPLDGRHPGRDRDSGSETGSRWPGGIMAALAGITAGQGEPDGVRDGRPLRQVGVGDGVTGRRRRGVEGRDDESRPLGDDRCGGHADIGAHMAFEWIHVLRNGWGAEPSATVGRVGLGAVRHGPKEGRNLPLYCGFADRSRKTGHGESH